MNLISKKAKYKKQYQWKQKQQLRNTWAKKVAREHLNPFKMAILRDMWDDAEQQSCWMEEPSTTESLTNLTVLSTKAHGPLSKSMKYIFRALEPWNQEKQRNIHQHDYDGFKQTKFK